MPYTNSWKLGNGSTATINSVAYDAVSIGIPNETRPVVEITALQSTRKEWVASDYPDSDEIDIECAYAGTVINTVVSGSVVSCSLVLSKLSKTLSFSGIITSIAPQAATMDGKLGMVLRVKPTTAFTSA